MNSNSIKDSFSWATHSFLLCFSGGLSYMFKKDVWKSFRPHDHLYDDLFVHKDYKTIDLVEQTNIETEKDEEDSWSEVA